MALPVIHRAVTIRRYPWRRRHPRLAVAALALAVAVAGAGAYRLWPRTVYLTYGSHVFSANLRGVEAKIAAENAWVARSGQPFVTIAVAATMSPDPQAEPLDPNRTRHAIEGAYLAQYESNHPSGPHGPPGRLLVKLLLADEGSREASWSPLATALQRAIVPDHLVAVTGLGISVASTSKLISRLEAGPEPLAMVGSVLTGSEFARTRGMVQVSPTTEQQAMAGVDFLAGLAGLPGHVRVWVVQDQNATDGYASALGSEFPKAIRHLPAAQRQRFTLVRPGTQYNSSLPFAATVLSGIGSTICQSGANVVYFAGRGVDLRGLLTGLASRDCAASQPLTVLTGSDASELIGQGELWPRGASLTAYYTALASPDVWRLDAGYVAPAPAAWFDHYSYGFFGQFPAEPGDALQDGWAIMFHDGVLAAQTAAGTLYQRTGQLPPAGLVAQELNQVTVPGASGYICFSQAHEPLDKAIPIVRLGQDGQLSFVRLSSASGLAPPPDPCRNG